MTKIQAAIITFFLALGVILPLSLASAEETTMEDVKSNAKICLDDYYNVAFKIRTDNMRLAYFSDMFTLNNCQINDILPLLYEYDAIKDQFRSDAANCGTVADYEQKILEYEAEMVRNLLEVHFVRNVRVVARNTSDIKKIQDMINAVLEDLSQEDTVIADLLKKDNILAILFNNMVAEFVVKEEMLTEEELLAMFTIWISKYSDTIIQYSSCTEGPVMELFESWFSFMETVNSLDIEIKKPEKKSFKDVYMPDLDVDDNGIVEGFNDGVQNVTDAWGKLKSNMKHAEQERLKRKAAAEAKAKAEAEAAAAAGNPSTQAELKPNTFVAYLEDLKGSTSDDEIFNASNARMSEYELLYGEIGAVSTTNNVIILDQLNNVIINNNIKDFPAIREALSKIYGKQCSG